jgi:hypothetical protein
MAAGVTTQPAFAFGNSSQVPKPATWLDSFGDNSRQYDVLSDGTHFIARIAAGTIGQQGAAGIGKEIRVVLNWFEELKQRVPVR